MPKAIYIFVFFLLSSISVSDTKLSFSLNSDSIWRGIDQNNGNPTLGAEAEIDLENGFYSNIWLESCCSESANYPNRELGFSMGYKIFRNEKISLSFGYIGTNYPDSKKDNYDEINLEIEVDGFRINIFKGLNNFPDYYELEYEFSFREVTYYISAGDFKPLQNEPESNGINTKYGFDFELFNLDLEFYYYHLNSNGNTNLNDNGLVFSISKSVDF
tara:strand:- start:1605 stop:2252 length:648 start_codon:yes stop_codon:yes gene_type:complete